MNLLLEKLKENKYLSRFFKGKSLIQLTRYVFTGFMAAALEYITFFILYKLSESLLLSNSAGMTAGFMLSFIVNRTWSFESKDNPVRQFLLYLVLFFINLAISYYLIHTLTNITGITPFISKVMVMCIMIMWNFVIYKKIIYKK